jgi:hypothetical protein
MKLHPWPNEAVNIAGNILLIVKLARNVVIEAKCITIVSEEDGAAIILQLATKCSGLREHLENKKLK